MARKISQQLTYDFIVSDDYFGEIAFPAYKDIRPIEERQAILKCKLTSSENWILGSSLCGWSDIFIPDFDLVVFLQVQGK